MTVTTKTVPRFALLGEDSRKSAEELVHCETIEVRSRRYDWEIPPHRHPALCQILLVETGSARIFYEDEWRSAPVPMIFVTPPGVVHGFSFSNDIVGHVLTLSSRFQQDFKAGTPISRLLSQLAIHELPPGEARRMAILADQIVATREPGEDADLLRRALAEALVRIAGSASAGQQPGHGDDMVRQFQSLVAEHGKEERKLEYYAAALGCTERTLNRRVGDALGLSPMQYIHERLAAEATRLLRFTNASCADVADELGFADPSYFSRFYARMTGERPSAVRGSTRDGPEPA